MRYENFLRGNGHNRCEVERYRYCLTELLLTVYLRVKAVFVSHSEKIVADDTVYLF